MTIRLARYCGPSDDQPAECNADFTIDGQSGHQKLHPGGTVILAAVDQDPQAAYRWEVITSPPNCNNLLTRITPHSASLSLPSPGAYVVHLTVTKGDCIAQKRYILWAVTPRLLYCIPATGEPLRFDGKPEWPGDLARLMLDVDRNLPTEAQKIALDKAHQPGENNPFATIEDLARLPGQPGRSLSDDEIDAIKAAENPNKCNPFITQSALPPAELTKDQKEAIEAADNPNRCNPFVTQSALPSLDLSDNQKAALRERPEHPPNHGNYFITRTELPSLELSDNQKAALREERAYPPTSDNLFITRQELPGPELSQNQKIALRERPEHPPGQDNYFVTRYELPEPELTPEQKAALDAAKEPDQHNPFITLNDLKEKFPLTDAEIAAIKQAGDPPHGPRPSGDNPFVTRGELPAAELTPAQKAALDGAQEPGGNNPFVTRSALPGPELTPEQKAALEAAQSPGATNPFITQSALPSPELTPNQKAAINTANNPSAANPFITLSNLPGPELSSDQKAALYAAKSPGATNPFITQSALPGPELTPEQKAALEAAHGPHADNPLATLADLNQIKPGVRIVAAGQVDLKQEAAAGANVWGGLKVVNNRLGKGTALLSFDGYDEQMHSRYIVKALPINEKVRNQDFNEFIIVQFVEFRAEGFVLQMAQPLVRGEGRAALGPCMIEVSEIVVNS